MPAYLHNGSMGDIIYALPVLRERPGVLHLTKELHRDFLSPLLTLQPYVQAVSLDYPPAGFSDLRKYRKITEADLTKHLAVCHAEAADVPVDLQTPWLSGVTPKRTHPIIINRTPRYHGELDWAVLQPHAHRVGFIGHQKEYRNFCAYAKFVPAHVPVLTALDMASIIAGSELFIGNQSLAFAIAEALKHPRILEVSTAKPNCMPHGPGGETKLTERSVAEWGR